MSGATDSGMVKTMGVVLASVTVLAVVCVLGARMLSSASDDFEDPMMKNAQMQRIQPLAAVRTSADDIAVAEPVVVAAAAKTGEEAANGACAACHVAGVAGAPKFGDEAAWAARRELGLDALVASVINGKGSMPARGGSPYSDDEIRAAVQYMAMFDDSESAAASDDAAEAAVTESAEAATEAPVEAAAALVVGQVPDGVTENIESAVNGVCAGCHIAGVAGAPKHGDTAAWQERADKGLDALTQSVINGLNAMPPRGGSGLTDAEIPIAIQYLMSK